MNRKVLYFGLILTLAAVFSIVGCDIDDDAWEDADIIITNQMDVPLDIYMEGRYQFTIAPYGGTGIIPALDWDQYLLDARDTFDGAIIRSVIIDIQANIEYQWVILPVLL